MIALTHYACISISGEDATRFLQGQLTCDVTKLNASKSTMGAHCNPKGRVISLFYCVRVDDRYLLIMPKSMISLALTALKKYSPFFKAVIHEALDVHLYGCIEPNPADTIQEPHTTLTITPSLHILVCHTPHEGATHDISPWQHELIKQHIPELQPASSEVFLPHELNLLTLNAISLDKGCYTGQEVIARIHYRSQITYHLVDACANTPLELSLGSDVYMQDMRRLETSTPHENTASIVGKVVNALRTSHDHHHLLLSIKQDDDPHRSLFIKPSTDSTIPLYYESQGN